VCLSMEDKIGKWKRYWDYGWRGLGGGDERLRLERVVPLPLRCSPPVVVRLVSLT
jgi:hypothetical protein